MHLEIPRVDDLAYKVRDSSKRFETCPGARIGRLVLSHISGKAKNGSKIWRCFCDCGNIKDIVQSSLRSGLTRSCGCFYRQCLTQNTLTHGMSDRPEYNSWLAMKQRCYYQDHDEYENYGGRGISVCEGWRNSFEQFYFDMGAKPSSEYSIDRIDCNRDYEPSNCKWSTPTQQANNTRKQTSDMLGISHHKLTGKWQLSVKINGKYKYIGLFQTVADAKAKRSDVISKQGE